MDLTCQECGQGFKSHKPGRQFCTDSCRHRHNRRRRDRGTELYDFVMLAHAGDSAVQGKAADMVAALCKAYTRADQALRQGRRSFQRYNAAVMGIKSVHGDRGDGR